MNTSLEKNKMNTDMKWAALAFFFVLGIPFAGLALDQYQKGQCRIEAIRAGMPADEIAKVCK
jgi:hypothetical protein